MWTNDENRYENQIEGSHWRWELPNENCPSSQLVVNLKIGFSHFEKGLILKVRNKK